MVTQRETLLAQTFVDVADTLVADFDVVEFLTVLSSRCVELFDLAEAGLLLGNGPTGGVRVAASSSHDAHLLDVLEIQRDEGPSFDCIHVGKAVRCEDLRAALDRWPRFADQAVSSGWLSAYALPMRLRAETIGSLNLLRAEPGVIDEADVVAAQALADVATIGILQHRAAEEHRLLAEQLQYALDSRVAIEQAKGVIGQHAGLGMSDAFSQLRGYARDHNRRLVDIAHEIVNRELDVDIVARPPQPS